MTIKEKKKLRTVRDYILISIPGPITFKYQAIIRPSIKWITILSLVCSLSIVFGKVFTILSIDYILTWLGDYQYYMDHTTCTW